MIIDVMCRIADGPLTPGKLEITQAGAPLVSWSVRTRDASETWALQGNDLAVELHLPDDTVWTGEAYPVAGIESDHEGAEHPHGPDLSLHAQLRGIGALTENSIPVHADVVVKRIDAILANG